MRRRSPLSATSAVAATLALVAASPAAAVVGTGAKGPTTTVDPYVLPVADGVQTTSLLTVADMPTVSGYKMVGIPDGLGLRNAATAGKAELFMNHELRETQGIVRAHGQKGSFVSNYRIDKTTLAVETGKDLIDAPGDVTFFNYPTGTYNAPGPNPSPASPAMGPFAAQNAAFLRFCSSTLTDPGQLFNPTTSMGYDGQIYFGNEEAGDEGRSFGILDDGTTKQLPRLGLFSWENTVPADNLSDTTLVQGQEDAATGQIWSYVGTKTNTGDAFDKAGLTNGTNHVVDLLNEAVDSDAEFRDTYTKGEPVPFNLDPVDWNQPGSAQNAEAATKGITLNRIEDGHWDPDNPRDFYFLTTEGGSTAKAPGTTNTRDGGGLWRLRYKDIEQPLKGGTLTLMLDGSETPYLNKPDNMTIDTHGNLLIQEDPGGNAGLARIVAYDINTGRRGVVARFDPALFAAGATGTVATTDEESSGIVDAKDVLGDGEFMFDAQVHKTVVGPDAAELVEYGQLLHLEVKDFEAVYTGRAPIQGPAGPPGPGGQNGAPGPAGPKGSRGPRGRNGKVTCKLNRRRTRVTCRVKYASKSKGRLVRAGKTVARGQIAKGRVTLASKKRLAKGNYTLVAGKLKLRVKLG